jgi:hypothetical protein
MILRAGELYYVLTDFRRFNNPILVGRSEIRHPVDYFEGYEPEGHERHSR